MHASLVTKPGRRIRALFQPARTNLPELDRAFDPGVVHELNAIDGVYLACAVAASADRFVTNSVKDFPKSIVEIDFTYPTDLPDPAEL